MLEDTPGAERADERIEPTEPTQSTESEPAKPPARPRRRRAASRPAGPPVDATRDQEPQAEPAPEPEPSSPPEPQVETRPEPEPQAAPPQKMRPNPPSVLFRAPEFSMSERTSSLLVGGDDVVPEDLDDEDADQEAADDNGEADARRRRRRRGGRGRRRKTTDDNGDDSAEEPSPGTASDAVADRAPAASAAQPEEPAESADEDESDESEATGSRRRRRRRRRRGEADEDEHRPDDPPETVIKVREPRPDTDEDEVTSLKGSTRIEAKKQRRREGREAGRRRAPIITEAEFLARRESVDRVMVVRSHADRTQMAVLEDGVLVEHYVSRESQQSLIGNVYLGRVQNVLPAMEAAFVDIGRGRNAILYAGEVDWDGLGMANQPKRIEEALKSGQSVLVQVTKDPIGHKGARLTSQISLPGRYLVYVAGGSMNGISRKLPDTERARLKKILKQVVPDDVGVIVRTAAEGATEDELTRDVNRLRAQWEDIAKKATANSAPSLLYREPDLTIKVVRDLYNEDFSKLVVSGDEAWETIDSYVSYVAPSLTDRLEKWTKPEDVFAAYRIEEQILKALERKVWLPSGGSLIIDRTEAMTVVDVNTGKFTGSGGNLEETVTRNNLEAAEEIVRQLRLRDIGGIIVIDFIDMVLESNRDLVLRRLVECLGRDRTKHQVAEVTSLGLVQMTRKRIGIGLLEAFSEPCDCCNGRGVQIHLEPVEPAHQPEERPSRRRRGKRGSSSGAGPDGAPEEDSLTADSTTGDPGLTES